MKDPIANKMVATFPITNKECPNCLFILLMPFCSKIAHAILPNNQLNESTQFSLFRLTKTRHNFFKECAFPSRFRGAAKYDA